MLCLLWAEAGNIRPASAGTAQISPDRSEYRIAEENTGNFHRLLETLLSAYEEPSSGDAGKIDAILREIRDISESDGQIADAVADHWRRVYLDPGYKLYLHRGGERADELEQTAVAACGKHAFVVLGYALKDGEMTDELKGRCDAAAAAARSFPDAILVCSGGATGSNNPEKHTEAGLMKDYLTEQCGLDASRIFIDERAMTTVENAVNTFEILREQKIETMTIVTSDYHQRWGQVIYNAEGALCFQRTGYNAKIVGNYCFEIRPSSQRYSQDAQIAARQLVTVLHLPAENDRESGPAGK